MIDGVADHFAVTREANSLVFYNPHIDESHVEGEVKPLNEGVIGR